MKIIVICPKHGKFETTPNQLLHPKTKYSCSHCRIEHNTSNHGNRYKTTQDYIDAVLKKWPKFPYSLELVNYKNAHDYVTLVCPKHGKFKYKAYSILLYGNVCPKCKHEKVLEKRKIRIIKQKNNFLKKYRKFFKKFEIEFDLAQLDKQQYNSSWYRNVKFKFVCKKHGIFSSTIETLIGYFLKNESPCIKCRGKIVDRHYTTQQFISMLKKIYFDKNYDYTKTTYVNWTTKVEIICPKHGKFKRLPQRLFEGRGCPHCKESLLEREIRQFLLQKKIDFVYQYRNTKLLGKKSRDFFLPKYNVAIECQGKQHLSTDSIFHKSISIKLEDIFSYDIIKYEICNKAGIKIYYYSHIKNDDYFTVLYNDKDQLLQEILKNG